jgi:large subunit ribosomal protein L19e
MDLHVQKRLAASLLGCSAKRVSFSSERLEEIKEAITKSDIRSLIKDGAIIKINKKGVSRARANKRKIQRRKGRQSGLGSRKGSPETHANSKKLWMSAIRVQRQFAKELMAKGLITGHTMHDILARAKGGFFRSRRHIKLYLEEHNLFSAGKGRQKRKEDDASAPPKEVHVLSAKKREHPKP